MLFGMDGKWNGAKKNIGANVTLMLNLTKPEFVSDS